MFVFPIWFTILKNFASLYIIEYKYIDTYMIHQQLLTNQYRSYIINIVLLIKSHFVNTGYTANENPFMSRIISSKIGRDRRKRVNFNCF